jgi:nicotinate phosphoribosyltransferase
MNIYNQSLALLTDFYQLTMAYGYWKAGLDKKEAVFHMFFRRPTFKGGFTIVAGLEGVVNYLANFRFDESDLKFLAKQEAGGERLFCDEFLAYLGNLAFSCDVDAVPEGSVVFPYEPLVRVKGPLIQCQILESPLLNLINFPTLIATKAARLRIAAGEDYVMEFGLRRAQGIDGALTAARASFIGGCNSTSNVLAAKLFNIPAKGTHSHSWVMVFDDELASFETYAKMLPDNVVLLVDTYNTIEGVEKAIEVGKWLRERGKKLLGVRLDSGDLYYLSKQSRVMLDQAGFEETQIFATNELDETLIADLKRQGAKITVWGVGTKLVTGDQQPALDGVYKLAAIRDPGGPWKYKLKISEQMIKTSNPGILQVKRYQKNNEYIADVIYDIHTDLSDGCHLIDPFDATRQKIVTKNVEGHDLLVPVFRNGELVYILPKLHAIQNRAKEELSHFYPGVARFLNPHQYVVGMEKSLYELKIKLVENIRFKKAHTYYSLSE